MAGIGLRLNRLFDKNSITTSLVGMAYSTVVTVAPMILVIAEVLLMGWALGFGSVGYVERELFSCTILYVFIFALLAVSPFTAVLSKYMQDAIYEERQRDILPCFYLGLFLNALVGCLMGIPFCLWEHFVGGVRVFYVFMGFCTFVTLLLSFYSMIYLSICKSYERISLSFLIGMAAAFFLSLALRYYWHWAVTDSMLFALMVGFFLIAVLEFSAVKRFFVENSSRYKPVIRYFGRYWKLVLTNMLYVLGLFVHNFVFWTTDMRIVVVRTFVCNQPYDMATCIAMFTNISATVIFISRVEMFFHQKYKAYSEAVIGAKLADIENAKRRMFRQIASELMTLVRIQFIISVTIYLLCVVLLPQFGFTQLIMRIYPCLAAGYFILFLMFAALLFLYYFNDMLGAILTTLLFCLVTFLGSLAATHLSEIWYGLGLLLGAFTGWTTAYIRLRWVERNMDRHIFCNGILVKQGNGPQPPAMVYSKAEELKKQREAAEGVR